MRTVEPSLSTADELLDEQWLRRTRLVRWSVTSVAVAVVAVVATLVVWRVDAQVEGRRGSTAEAASSTAGGAPGTSAGTGADRGDGAPRSATGEALTVLRSWDARRAAAWASGDAVELARLYPDGSEVGALDVDRLQRWRTAGYTVEGVAPQVLELEVARRDERTWVLEVTDRVPGAVAVRDGERVTIPGTVAQRRRVTLVRAGSSGDDAGWVVSDVRASPSATRRG